MAPRLPPIPGFENGGLKFENSQLQQKQTSTNPLPTSRLIPILKFCYWLVVPPVHTEICLTKVVMCVEGEGGVLNPNSNPTPFLPPYQTLLLFYFEPSTYPTHQFKYYCHNLKDLEKKFWSLGSKANILVFICTLFNYVQKDQLHYSSKCFFIFFCKIRMFCFCFLLPKYTPRNTC